MIQNLLPLLPRRIGMVEFAGLAGSLVIGCGLWLAGARFSRPLLALAATVGGGAIGFQTPHWFGWTIDPWMLAVLGALLLGIVGFLAHVQMAALGLGFVVAIWTLLAIIAAVGVHQTWQWPSFTEADAISTYFSTLQQSLAETIDSGPGSCR